MMQLKIEMDPNLKKFLRKGLPDGIRRGVHRSVRETRSFMVSHSTKELKDSRGLHKSTKRKDLNQVVSIHPHVLPSAKSLDLSNLHFTVAYSAKRQNLFRVPFATKKKMVTIRLKGNGKVKRRKVQMNQISTNIYNKGLRIDPLKPFWIGRGSSKGDFISKRKPAYSDKPIALYRKTSKRTPLAAATAPSISDIIRGISGLAGRLQGGGVNHLAGRMRKNVGYYINLL